MTAQTAARTIKINEQNYAACSIDEPIYFSMHSRIDNKQTQICPYHISQATVATQHAARIFLFFFFSSLLL
jgi:hypothetical protein